MHGKTIIISGFPGIGKSYLTKANMNGELFNSIKSPIEAGVFRDSDSSLFSWIYNDGVKTDTRDPGFPDNYIDHIRRLYNDDKTKVIFVSSHKAVRQALTKANIKYITIYPNINMKDIYISKYRERGNDDAFINFISSNWDEFINELDGDTNPCIIDRVELNYTLPHIDLRLIEYLFMAHVRGCRL